MLITAALKRGLRNSEFEVSLGYTGSYLLNVYICICMGIYMYKHIYHHLNRLYKLFKLRFLPPGLVTGLFC